MNVTIFLKQWCRTKCFKTRKQGRRALTWEKRRRLTKEISIWRRSAWRRFRRMRWVSRWMWRSIRRGTSPSTTQCRKWARCLARSRVVALGTVPPLPVRQLGMPLRPFTATLKVRPSLKRHLEISWTRILMQQRWPVYWRCSTDTILTKATDSWSNIGLAYYRQSTRF